MSSIIFPQTSVVGIGIYNACIPKNGGRCVPLPFDFSAVGVTEIKFDYSRMAQRDFMTYCQTLFIDNADNAQPVTIIVDETNQRIVAPPNSQGYYPCLMNTIRFTIRSTSGGRVPVNLINIPIPGAVWRVV